jgi:hypothetical protein
MWSWVFFFFIRDTGRAPTWFVKPDVTTTSNEPTMSSTVGDPKALT